MDNGWKIIAVISIILNILVTLLFGTAVFYGMDLQEKKTQCYTKYMSDEKAYDYLFDEYSYICYLSDVNGLVYSAEVLK